MIEQFTLKNDIRVIFEQNNNFNSAAFGVWVGVGSRDENKENNGMSHMIEHMLFKGTTTKTAEEIAISTAILGGNLNAYTSKECTSFYCKTLPEDIYTAIDIIGDMLSNPLLDEEDFEKEKLVVCEEIDMYNDSCEDYVHEVLQKKIWNKEPLGYLISGKKKVVKGFTISKLKEFMQQYYVGKNIVISVAGAFNSEKVREAINKSFSSIKKTSITCKNGLPKRIKPEYKKVCFTTKRDIEQLHINMAFEIPSFKDKLRYEFTIINSILGGDVNSRLFQLIREKNGLTYNICSYGSAFSDTGLMHIYAALNTSQKDKVLQLIESIISDLCTKGVTAIELENAKRQTIAELTLGRDNTVSLMNSNAKMITFSENIISYKQTINAINCVSLDSVNECIKKYFDLNKASIAMAGRIK